MNTLEDGVQVKHEINATLIDANLDSGVEAGRASRVWEERGIAISDGNTLDVNLHNFFSRDIGAGTGKDPLGQFPEFVEIVCLVIKCSKGPGVLEINPNGGAANPIDWIPVATAKNSDLTALAEGDLRMWYDEAEDALPITSSSSDTLRVRAQDGDVEMDLFVLARHDADASSSSSSSQSTQSAS